MVNLNEDGYTDTLQSIANLQHLLRQSKGQEQPEIVEESASERGDQEGSEEEKEGTSNEEKKVFDPNELLNDPIQQEKPSEPTVEHETSPEETKVQAESETQE